MEPALLSIGTFSRLTGISVPTLRRYDAIGLLRPVAVDETTGYRRYDRAQLGSARTIRRLRDLDVPLDIVRAILDADEAEARALLERHRERLEARSWRDQRRLHRLRQLIDRKGNVMIEDEAERRMERADQRRLAADLFNFVWTLLEDPDRTPEQDERMVHAAHPMR